MRIFGGSRLAIVVLSSCVTAGCQTADAINGSGYQMTRFSDPVAARAASVDPTAGPAIASNNEQCRKDAACRK